MNVSVLFTPSRFPKKYVNKPAIWDVPAVEAPEGDGRQPQDQGQQQPQGERQPPGDEGDGRPPPRADPTPYFGAEQQMYFITVQMLIGHQQLQMLIIIE